MSVDKSLEKCFCERHREEELVTYRGGVRSGDIFVFCKGRR